MAHPAPRTSKDSEAPVYLEQSLLSLVAVSFFLIHESLWIILGILWGGWALSLPGYILYTWMRDNAETHSEEWQDKRFHRWLMKDLPPLCEAVGHESNGAGRCMYCDKIVDYDALPDEEKSDAVVEDMLALYQVPPHQIGEAEPLTSWEQYNEHAEAVNEHYKRKRELVEAQERLVEAKANTAAAVAKVVSR